MVEATRQKAAELEVFLKSRGVTAWTCSAWETDEARALLNGTELVLTVGGDGTILRATQVVFPGTVPIAGINLGKLGFMTEIDVEEALEKLPVLLDGNGWLDERTVLEVELSISGQPPRFFHALNDVVVARGEIARLIRVETSIDGQNMTTHKADGVIVATATGSTGYSLAAGGPILYPQSSDFLLVPVAPHLTPGYAVVLPGTAEVRLTVLTVNPATVSVDGHINLPISDNDTVTIKRSADSVRFLRIRSRDDFFGSLEARLKGKIG
jgi:NAD+ kinase